MAMTMGQFLALASPGLDEIWHSEEQKLETQYTRVFKTIGLNELKRDEAKMAGFGGLVEIGEGAAVTYDEAIEPVTREYNYVVRGLGYKVTQKFWMNDLYREVNAFEADLRFATNDDIEQFAFNLLNSGTTTTISAGFDGLALFSTAHTRMDGAGTLANRPTTLTALSVASLQDALVGFKNLKDDRGRPYRSVPSNLVIPYDLEPTAIEILESSMRPDTSNNATNAITRYGITPIATPYITSSTFCALRGSKHDVKVLFRFRPKMSNKVDFETETIHRKVMVGLGRGHGEWRGWWLLNS